MKKIKYIGEMIKGFRKANRMSQSDLGDAIGVTYQQIQKYEKGISSITIERLKQMSDALNVSILVFFKNEAGKASQSKKLHVKVSSEERLFLKLFSNIKNEKSKKAVLGFLRALSRKR